MTPDSMGSRRWSGSFPICDFNSESALHPAASNAFNAYSKAPML